MDASEALRRMIRMSGKSNRQISREIGKADSFVSASLAQGVRPRIDTFARIAEACGYEVLVRSADDSFSLTPQVAVEYAPHDQQSQESGGQDLDA